MKASQTQVFLFDGERKTVQDRVNGFLRTLGREGSLEPEIVVFGFNYQGPEWDGKTCIDGSASHGLMLVAYYPTINEAREMRGFDPVAAQPGGTPMGEGLTAIPVEEILKAMTREPPRPPSLFGRLFGRFFERGG